MVMNKTFARGRFFFEPFHASSSSSSSSSSFQVWRRRSTMSLSPLESTKVTKSATISAAAPNASSSSKTLEAQQRLEATLDVVIVVIRNSCRGSINKASLDALQQQRLQRHYLCVLQIAQRYIHCSSSNATSVQMLVLQAWEHLCRYHYQQVRCAARTLQKLKSQRSSFAAAAATTATPSLPNRSRASHKSNTSSSSSSLRLTMIASANQDYIARAEELAASELGLYKAKRRIKFLSKNESTTENGGSPYNTTNNNTNDNTQKQPRSLSMG